MTRNPSREATAKHYAELVLDQQVKADSDVKRLIRQHLSEIINDSKSYTGDFKRFRFTDNKTINDKVDKAITALNEAIMLTFETRAINVKQVAEKREDDKSDDVALILWLLGKIGDKTLKDRATLYTSQLKTEIEAFVAAGMAKGLSSDAILNNWLTYMKAPYSSPLIREAMATGGFSATVLASRGLHLGKGLYISSFENIKRLEQATIQMAYNKTLFDIWGGRGVVGFYTIRGSSYPCGVCDSQVGLFHSKDEFFSGYHQKCACLVIPVYAGEI